MLLEHLFRHQSGRVVAHLTHLLGPAHLDLAEEAMQEAFSSMQEELEQERRWFARKWARQEKALRAMVDNVSGLHGDFEGLNGLRLLPAPEAESDEGVA